MKDIRPYICKKLKEMHESGKPVWIGINGRRYLIGLFDPWSEDWPLFDQGWFLTKKKGRYFISYVCERQGRAQVSRCPGDCYSFQSLNSILAIVLEVHPYEGMFLAPNDPETMKLYQKNDMY
ncbi:MAG: hypothetical protein H7831_11685, partial [Magnetococcus sp. WYHC-3]